MIKSVAAVATLVVALSAASPAFAVFCNGGTSEITTGFSFEFGNNDGFLSSTDPYQFEQMQLKQAGVDAERVETWNGCLRVFTPQGMRFFDPDTLEEVF